MLLIITTYGQFEPVSRRPFFARDRASEKSILSLWPETKLKPLGAKSSAGKYDRPCCFLGPGITIVAQQKNFFHFWMI